MVKFFALDTNIILQSPRAMCEGFADNTVIITGTTLQELDSKKHASGDLGYNAREAIRILDSLRQKGDLKEGIDLDNGGRLMLEAGGVDQSVLPEGYSISAPDNRIISTCLTLAKRLQPLILVSNDISMRVNASILGLRVEEYRNDQVDEETYTGHSTCCIEKSLIDTLYVNGTLPAESVSGEQGGEYMENNFITLTTEEGQSALTVFRGGDFHLIPSQKTFGGIKPLNAMQSYALWALRAPAEEIPLVILLGAAGTAKTLLSLAAGMEYTYTGQSRSDVDRYNKVLLSRPNGIGFSNIGFLPGDLDRKLSPLMASYYDNMEILLSANGKEYRDQVQTLMDDILDSGVVELCSLDFIRGRSLMNTYIICDEAQNASKTLIRDVITRAGKGTKVIIAGDPGQIDVPSLDKRNNGLVYAASAMAGDPTTAIIHFPKSCSVRSPLAKAALDRMKF